MDRLGASSIQRGRPYLLFVFALAVVGCSGGPAEGDRDAGRADLGADSPGDGGVDNREVDAGTPDGGGSGCTPEPGLGLNDVSFLFPLPPSASENLLLPVTASGARGVLLPERVRTDLPPSLILSGTPVPPSSAFVVAARVDPCFRVGEGPCRKQIRLVAQPLAASGEGALDATVHLFYDLPDGDFSQVRDELLALKRIAGDETRCAPLGVHPVMKREGLAGPFAVRLKALILRFCGEQTLSQVAVMTFSGQIPFWSFRALDVAGGLTPVAIPRTQGATHQDFAARSGPVGGPPRYGTLQPEPIRSKIPVLLDYQAIRDQPEPVIRQAVDESWALEDPKRESAGTADCLSCHLAGRARELALEDRGVSADPTDSAYRNPRHDLSLLPDGAGVQSQRAFGYVPTGPSITQRVINESAEAADALNGM
jgi:hypothetical protein